MLHFIDASRELLLAGSCYLYSVANSAGGSIYINTYQSSGGEVYYKIVTLVSIANMFLSTAAADQQQHLPDARRVHKKAGQNLVIGSSSFAYERWCNIQSPSQHRSRELSLVGSPLRSCADATLGGSIMTPAWLAYVGLLGRPK